MSVAQPLQRDRDRIDKRAIVRRNPAHSVDTKVPSSCNATPIARETNSIIMLIEIMIAMNESICLTRMIYINMGEMIVKMS